MLKNALLIERPIGAASRSDLGRILRFIAAVSSFACSTLLPAGVALAAEDDEDLGPKLLNASMALELQSRAHGLGASATTVDTTYVGYTPGKFNASNNYWSIWSGSDKFSVPAGPYHRPPFQGTMWDFNGPYTDVHGDSLQGWWPLRDRMSGTGGLTLPDYNRPWRALDYGNQVNYTYGPSKRTFGVTGLWHVDGGSTIAVPASTTWTGEPANSGGVTWAPLTGVASAWMGMRRHGDTSHVDDVARGGTGNPFNEDTYMYQEFNSASGGGTDKKFPGYGTSMDQILYRDIDMSGPGDNTLTVSFQYRTSMSESFDTDESTRSGWFVHDPLTVTTGGANPNFISNNPTVAAPPVDSFMVYVGAPAEGSVLLSDGTTHSIYDAKRRWFGEVIRSNEGLYKQIHSSAGTVGPTNVTNATVSATVIAAIKAAAANRVRLVFRVKTNHVFDDATSASTGYSSLGAGAVVLDQVSVAKGTGPTTVIGAFESASEIDNSTGVTALSKWKSTGKAPQTYYHPHFLSDDGPSGTLVYQDICGQVGNPARVCDMEGVVVSAGAHDHDERSGGLFGSAEQEPFQGMISPTINLAAGSLPNSMGLTASTAEATDDYFIDYELYTGIFDTVNQGNEWRFGFQCYPAANTSTGTGEHARWGEIRFPSFTYFNPDKQCFRSLDAVMKNGLLRTTNPDGVPDSCRIYVGTRQEVYRFGIPQSEWFDGAYWDNLSLAIVDGVDPISMNSLLLYQDTFSANSDLTFVGVPSKFDTTVALIRNGLNISPKTGNSDRFNVPGDTTVVLAEGNNMRVDMVFRILPGPGNYVNAALGVNSQLRATANNVNPIPVPAAGTANFWSNYMFNNGTFGSAGGHPTASSGPLAGQKIWSPHVWNSARMDTAQINVFPMKHRRVRQVMSTARFMTAYHETELADPHRGALGLARNICFVASNAPATSTRAIICGSGNVPGSATYPPSWTTPATGFNGQTTTMEGTKIIPDGLLTPGAHVEYFFRSQNGAAAVVLAPDTNVVTPQVSEGSTDGHRWQQFGVLPDRWKSVAYTHPVLGTPGRGDACMLYIDQNDRRGNERTWVGVADSIGATRAEKYGAHNGWHAPGDGDVNDPLYFVRRHIGQPGTTWDMYGVKGAESRSSGSGSLGSRGGFDPLALSYYEAGNIQINGKTSRQGPSEAMLNAYYKVLMVLTGDMSSAIFGPFVNKSQDDYRIIQNFLDSGDPSTPNRGFFAEGNGFAEALDQSSEGFAFLTDYLGAELRSTSYLSESGNTAWSADILSTPWIEGPSNPLDIYGVRNVPFATLDVLDQTVAMMGETGAATFYEPVGANAPYISGVIKLHSPAKPWTSLLDGWDIELLQARDLVSSRGRLAYLYNVFSNIFSVICDVNGAPVITTDTPRNDDGRLFNFMSLANNPLKSGLVTINLGIAKTDRVKIQIFDVGGRLVRTLADRRFTAGEHVLTWDGVDNSGRSTARGVYFVRSQHADSKFTGQSKLVLLK